MVQVVADAIRGLEREQWWDSVREGLDALSDADADAYRADVAALDGSTSDGLVG